MFKRIVLVAAVSTVALLVVKKLRVAREERELWQEATSAPELLRVPV
ncbi:MAG: DLW-39 family protein [Mycobacteriales bacterium]